VIVIANGLPILVLCFAWQGLYHPDWVIAHPAWCFLEMLSAFSWLFLFGAGLYFGPAFLFLAGLVRAWQWLGPRPAAYARVAAEEQTPAAPDTGLLPLVGFKVL
jgi:hypothetical protein